MSEPIRFSRGLRMTSMAHKVLDIMQRDGGITHLNAVHYNIGDVRREISRIRDAVPYGYAVLTTKRIDADGNRYTRWVLHKICAWDTKVPGVMYGRHNDFISAA